jgi:hypothetical protein
VSGLLCGCECVFGGSLERAFKVRVDAGANLRMKNDYRTVFVVGVLITYVGCIVVHVRAGRTSRTRAFDGTEEYIRLVVINA